MAYPDHSDPLRILVCGASGFIGAALARALELRGHVVLRGVRNPGHHAQQHSERLYVDVDYQRDQEASAWTDALQGVHVVVNAVGILRERGRQSFDALHVQGPVALFEACAQTGVARVIQISALGADAQAATAYHVSKLAADEALRALPVSSVVLQPSLVFGAHGASTRLFTTLASLPMIPLPGNGEQLVQPVHLDDLCSAVVLLAETLEHGGERIAVVGPEALPLRDYLALLREQMGMGRGRHLAVPANLVSAAAGVGDHVRGALLDRDSWRMLQRGSTGSDAALTEVLGRAPLAPEHFVEPEDRAALANAARLAWLLPLVRLSLALVWFAAGAVSLGIYPVEDSLALLARVGAGPEAGLMLLYGAAAVDIALGVATLFWPRRWLWVVQAALVLGYTAIITVFLPEQWLHPFGPVVKNLPFLAALALLYSFEERR
ncbi:MAG: SDR family oxidoreductase [Hydrogenophaga sp.]|nr:SDR family oxidoreductase [Hydrogenophaga sp.]